MKALIGLSIGLCDMKKDYPKQQTIAALTEDAVKKMIKAQLAKTNNAPSYESIESNQPNLESLPEHVEIKKSKISGNGIFFNYRS